MKAVILAGGKGTRARPFTNYFPKAMIPVNDVPLIGHVVNYLASTSLISEIIIVADISGLGGQIKHYFENYRGKKLKFVQDSTSGTAGDLLYLSKLIKEEPFVLWFVDNLGAVNLKEMYEHFVRHGSTACIATRQFRKEETGFAKVRGGKVVEFIEKPLLKMTDHECTGIYILSGKILGIIKKSKSKKNLNLSYDILQGLSKNGLVSAFDIGKTPWMDVESPSVLQRNTDTIKKIIGHMDHSL